MPQKTTLPFLALGALFSLPAWADDAAAPSPLTANVSIVSDYLFRGLSRTNGYPAVQGGVDLAASNGIYVGVWGSNISWLADQGTAKGSSLELDPYVGIKNSFFTDFTYDFGVMRYHYPANYTAGVAADTDEIHVALGYQWLSVKYSYALSNAFGIADSKGTHYTDISVNYPVTDSGFTLGAHYGVQTYQGVTASNMKAAGMDPSYSDAKMYLTKDMNGFVLGVAYSRAFKLSNNYINSMGNNLGRSKWVFSLSRTF
ncbi:MAG TPA: TorF family putative porin [Gallionellaceae bacterium]